MSARRSKPLLQRWLRATPLLIAAACGGPQKLGDAGATCFRDDDCTAGLICVAAEEGDINRVCSDDPTPLISNVDGPPVMMAMGAAGAGGAAGMATAGSAPMAGAGGTDVVAAGTGGGGGSGSGGQAGNGGTPSAGTDTGGTMSGSAGTDAAGTAGTAPEGGAPL